MVRRCRRNPRYEHHVFRVGPKLTRAVFGNTVAKCYRDLGLRRLREPHGPATFNCDWTRGERSVDIRLSDVLIEFTSVIQYEFLYDFTGALPDGTICTTIDFYSFTLVMNDRW